MTNYQSGHDAEKTAADYLRRQGFEIIELNWKTRYCEIDIVARKDNVIYFVEVKSRRSQAFGGGFEHITSKKLKQMTYAAEIWVSNNKWDGDYRLSAIAIDSGQTQFLEQVS